MDNKKEKEIKIVLKTLSYDEMDDKQKCLVLEYETEKFKKKLDKLSNKTLEQKENWIHDKWLNYEMSDQTEEDLYKYIGSN